MTECWESWIGDLSPPSHSVWSASLLDMLRKESPGAEICMLTRFITGILERVEEVEGLECYGLMRREVTMAYHTLEQDHRGLSGEWERIRSLARFMWKLEEGFSLQRLTPDLTPQEAQERLRVMDAARPLFGKVLRDAFHAHHLFSDRNLLIAWGGMMYYHVHCFQAPNRTTPEQAIRDSMGLSDHFGELLEAAMKDTPEGRVK